MKALRAFVSGKEGELSDEREMARQVLDELGLEPISSESRDASDRPIESEFIEEVRTSDIYIGLFDRIHSDATIKEFRTARANNIPVLVFVRKLTEGAKRRKRLINFIEEVKQPRDGITYVTFDHIIDLGEKIRRSLMGLLARRFHEARALESKARQGDISKLELDRSSSSLQRSKFKPGSIKRKSRKQSKRERNIRAPTFGLPFPLLQDAEITTFSIPKIIQKNKSFEIQAAAEGKFHNSFLDLALRDSAGNVYWIPDPNSWDAVKDTGKLSGMKYYASMWDSMLPPNAAVGTCVAFMALYSDTPTPGMKARHISAFEEKSVQIK